MISIRNLTFRREDHIILNDVNLEVNHGDFVAITGPNGGGKTTLLRVILGLLKPSSGSVSFEPKHLTIGYLPQKNMIDAQFPVSVREVVRSGLLGIKHLSDDERGRRTMSTLAQIEMEELADRPIGRLSGGQLQRALLGRAIISQPRLLVLDEPLSYIDKHFESRIYRLISGIASHCTILLVSHEMTAIASMANRHLIVDRTVTECTATHHYAHSECDDCV